MAVVTKSINAENTWTDIVVPKDNFYSGHLNISVTGVTWEAIVTLQRSFDSGATWNDVTTYESNAEKSLMDEEFGVQYKIGVKTGEYTSGTVLVRLSF